MTGAVFNIQRFCVQDGPGVRTTVFLKGCHLRCAWCHNPESHKMAPEIMFDAAKCLFCGGCAGVCENHRIAGGVHEFFRDKCTACGKCAGVCFSGALELCGKEMTPEEVMETVIRDRDFYGQEGGLTISGGEPLMQRGFTTELARMARESGIGVCVETSGDGEWGALRELARYTDIFLYDIKLMDGAAHKKHTGISNGRILENLRRLDEMGVRTVLRCPVIPGVNDDPGHFEAVARLAGELKNVSEVQFEPYHPLGVAKARRIGRESPYSNEGFMSRERVEELARAAQAFTKAPFTVQ